MIVRAAGAFFSLLAFGLFGGTSLIAQQEIQAPRSLVGLWEGSVIVESDSLLVRIVVASDSAGLTGTVDVPDQYAVGYKLATVVQDGEAVHFELGDNLFPGTFEGVVEGGRIHGAFTGVFRGDSVGGAFDLWRRPPSEPPYASEKVRFHDGDLELVGTVFVPSDPGPHSAVVFLHGSGPQTRESYIRFFADRFARAGFVTLIYDKRGTGESGGERWPATQGGFVDLAEDGRAAVRALATREDVDRSRIGVWGLSQGAWLAPLAARAGGTAFVIMLSGGGVSPAEQELYDDEVRLRARGFSEAEIADALTLLRLADDYVRSGTDPEWERFEAAREAARPKPWFGHLDRFPLILPREAPVWGGLRGDLDYDPAPALESLRVPVLVILGERDELTPTTGSAERIAGALGRARNADATIRIVPGADHGLWVRGTGKVWDRPAAGWIDQMIEWARSISHSRGGNARPSNLQGR